MAIEITHIRLSGTTRTHEAITHVRWTNTTNPSSTGTNTKAEMVDWIDKDGVAYVGPAGTNRARVGTVHPQHGDPYLRTYADGTWTNNLLALPLF